MQFLISTRTGDIYYDEDGDWLLKRSLSGIWSACDPVDNLSKRSKLAKKYEKFHVERSNTKDTCD